MKKQPLLFLLVFLFATGELKASDTLKQWQVFEVKMTAEKNYENPYWLVPVNDDKDFVYAEFKGINGDAEGKTVTVAGFWDGGKDWKIRFTPPFIGQWKYNTISADKGLNDVKGSLTVTGWNKNAKNENPTRHGFVQVMNNGENAGHYFKYADGTPFLWIADTWWNWTDKRLKFSTFKHLVDDRSAKGFDIGQLFVAANGWGRESSLLDETYTIPDIQHIKKVDSMIAYANSKGITVWIHGWWSRKNLNETAGAEKIKRWWHYLINRYAAYNVIWVMAGEYNMNNYGGFPLSFWKNLGQFIKDKDPYNRIVSVHNTPPGWEGGADAPQWSTAEVLHDEKWLDYNQSQVGHGKWYNEMIPWVVSEAYKKTPAKPIVVTEPWYEFAEGSAPAMDIRFGAWSAILSGAAGHTYGGGHVWLAYTPETAGGGNSSWPLEKDPTKNTLDYPGALSISYLANFFKKIQWWNLSPDPELLHEYPAKYCLAKPGEEYVIYLRYAGGVKVDLLPSSKDDLFEYYWFDPGSGKYSSPKEINGGDIHYFSAPGSYPAEKNFKDWVLYIKRK
jgi:hypothetical protein